MLSTSYMETTTEIMQLNDDNLGYFLWWTTSRARKSGYLDNRCCVLNLCLPRFVPQHIQCPVSYPPTVFNYDRHVYLLKYVQQHYRRSMFHCDRGLSGNYYFTLFNRYLTAEHILQWWSLLENQTSKDRRRRLLDNFLHQHYRSGTEADFWLFYTIKLL